MLDVKALLTKVLEALKVDYIVEQGTDGGWTYRKWNSGIAECWYRGNYGSVTLNTILATDIVSASMQFTYPFTFATIPTCSIQYEGSTTGYAGVQYPGTPGTTTKSPTFRLVRIGSQSVTLQNCYVCCYAIGKWK